MSLGVDHARMIEAYREIHAEVDWGTQEIYFGKDRDGIWYVRGHRPKDPERDALIARIRSGCCCPEDPVSEVEGTTRT